MTKKSPAYVPDAAFNSAVKRISIAIVNINETLDNMKKNMATKGDIDRLLNKMADFAKKTSIALQKHKVHLDYFRDYKFRLTAIEKHPIS